MIRPSTQRLSAEANRALRSSQSPSKAALVAAIPQYDFHLTFAERELLDKASLSLSEGRISQILALAASV